MSRVFQYQQRRPEDWDRRANQSGSNFIGIFKDEFDVFSAKKDNWVRMLPPTWEKPNHYGYDIYVHYGVGPQNGQVLCNAKMYNQACFACEQRAKFEAQGNKDAADDLKPTRRVVVWLLDRADKESENKPQVWAMPWTMDRDLTKVCKDKQTGEIYYIDDPDQGYDISFEVEGERPNIKYVGQQVARRPSSVDDAPLKFILENPIPTTLINRTYDEVKALFIGEPPAPAPAPAAKAEPEPQKAAPTQREAFTGRHSSEPANEPKGYSAQMDSCGNVLNFRGQRLVCSLPQGHEGEHEYQMGFPEMDQAPDKAEPPKQEPPAPRSASLRGRFANVAK